MKGPVPKGVMDSARALADSQVHVNVLYTG